MKAATKQELARLETLIKQLINLLDAERETNAKLQTQLTMREAELQRVRSQLQDTRQKVENLFSQLRASNDSPSN